VLNYGGLGHLAGTPLPNQLGNAVLPGHRTSHGGPLRKLHTMVPGDTIVVATTDGLVKTYQMSEPSFIVAAADRATVVNWGDPSVSSITLVACSKRNKLPTDVRFRLVARFVEVPPAQ
jgi:sortase A